MITKNDMKRIQGLGSKKNRIKTHFFVAEGKKVITSFFDAGFVANDLFTSDSDKLFNAHLISPKTMQRISQLKNASSYLATFRLPELPKLPEKGRFIVVEQLADPGNLGTLIRLCDWFGISHLICSENSVDCFNPKVVQASMGSLARVHCHYLNLKTFFINNRLPVYGTYLEGESIYNIKLPKDAILLFGSESQGISKEISSFVEKSITIPKKTTNGPESLNVAIAAAICLSEFIR